jgi:hypothetical protein
MAAVVQIAIVSGSYSHKASASETSLNFIGEILHQLVPVVIPSDELLAPVPKCTHQYRVL